MDTQRKIGDEGIGLFTWLGCEWSPELAHNAEEAKAWGRAGKAIAERVTWDACIDALLA